MGISNCSTALVRSSPWTDGIVAQTITQTCPDVMQMCKNTAVAYIDIETIFNHVVSDARNGTDYGIIKFFTYGAGVVRDATVNTVSSLGNSLLKTTTFFGSSALETVASKTVVDVCPSVADMCPKETIADFAQIATPTVSTSVIASLRESFAYGTGVVCNATAGGLGTAYNVTANGVGVAYNATADTVASLGNSALDVVSSNPFTSAILTAGITYAVYARHCEQGRRAEVNKKIDMLKSDLQDLGNEIVELKKIVSAAKEDRGIAG